MASSSTYKFPPKIFLWDLQLEMPKKSALGMGLPQSEANTAAGDAAAEEESKCLAAEAAGKGEKSDEGASAVNAERCLHAEAFEVTEDGYF